MKNFYKKVIRFLKLMATGMIAGATIGATGGAIVYPLVSFSDDTV